ncbi:MAG TPA: hypothetical protein VGN63_16765 [Flavisolibacter sp.]|jgi:hypothetical protein|nr:hypothetical protein [Flavisolibacter sp.]
MNTLPFRFAQLIIRYTHNLLSEAEMDELDNFIVESDENVEIFLTLTEGLDDRIFSADELIIDTEDLLDNWMVAGLVAREMQGILGEDEKQALENWLAESETHQRLYALFQDKANLQKFVRWMKGLRDGGGKAGMN